MLGTLAFVSFLIGATAAGLSAHDLYQRGAPKLDGKDFWYDVAQVLGGFCIAVTALRALIYA